MDSHVKGKNDMPDAYAEYFDHHYKKVYKLIDNYAKESDIDFEIYCNILQNITADAIGVFICELIVRKKMDEKDVVKLAGNIENAFRESILNSMKKYRELSSGTGNCQEHSDNS